MTAARRTWRATVLFTLAVTAGTGTVLIGRGLWDLITRPELDAAAPWLAIATGAVVIVASSLTFDHITRKARTNVR